MKAKSIIMGVALCAISSLSFTSCYLPTGYGPDNGYDSAYATDYGYGGNYVTSSYVSGGGMVGGTYVDYQYDSYGYPVFGYAGGQPIYGYTYAGSPIFSINLLIGNCYVPPWRPAAYWHGVYRPHSSWHRYHPPICRPLPSPRYYHDRRIAPPAGINGRRPDFSNGPRPGANPSRPSGNMPNTRYTGNTGPGSSSHSPAANRPTNNRPASGNTFDRAPSSSSYPAAGVQSRPAGGSSSNPAYNRPTRPTSSGASPSGIGSRPTSSSRPSSGQQPSAGAHPSSSDGGGRVSAPTHTEHPSIGSGAGGGGRISAPTQGGGGLRGSGRGR